MGIANKEPVISEKNTAYKKENIGPAVKKAPSANEATRILDESGLVFKKIADPNQRKILKKPLSREELMKISKEGDAPQGSFFRALKSTMSKNKN